MHACMHAYKIECLNGVSQTTYHQEYFVHIQNQDPNSFSLRDAYMHAYMPTYELKIN